MKTITRPKTILFFFLSIGLMLQCKSDVQTQGNLEPPDAGTNTTEHSILDTFSSTKSTSDDTVISTSTESELNGDTLKSIEIKKSIQQSIPPIAQQKIKKPKMEFEELSWNFGEIKEGDIVKKDFKFTNIGNAPLQIYSTNASCGCTMPSFPFLDIEPGESNIIGVTFNSVGKEGKQDLEVKIVANTTPKTTILKLEGFVTTKNAALQQKEIPVDSATTRTGNDQ